MHGTRFGGSPRARSRSKSARRPLCANLISAIVSRSGTFYSAAKPTDARQPDACDCAMPQARVLPRFAAAEDATRLAEVMSFARCHRGRVRHQRREPPGRRVPDVPFDVHAHRDLHHRLRGGGVQHQAVRDREAPLCARARQRTRSARYSSAWKGEFHTEAHVTHRFDDARIGHRRIEQIHRGCTHRPRLLGTTFDQGRHSEVVGGQDWPDARSG